jgi:mRNA interferase MazF
MNSRPRVATEMVRGELFRLRTERRLRGREQAGARYAVVVQADELLGTSTVLVAPTSASASYATFRPVIEVAGIQTRVLVEQTRAVDPGRLGGSAGRLDAAEAHLVDEALRLVFGL